MSATIGLGRYGEMFSSMFDHYKKVNAVSDYLSSARSSNGVMYFLNVLGELRTSEVSEERPPRLWFYLKSDVMINDGTGLPHDPYEIVQ